ncbi:MAG TPA: LLM class F420-dependent oxidoreductase [Phototrophicaceae bacterium]|nr:LLM class F420-dependent oxidoreductase [Phototrophicaceae bacterium]
MKIGLQIPSFDWPSGPEKIGPVLLDIARAADQGGFASLWLMDHFFQIGGAYGEPEAPMLEGYTTLGYLAAVTQKLRLGLMVTGAIYRHPGLLLKTVTTLDVLTGGRAYLGIGAGWYEREARGLGVPFPPTKERLECLEEVLRLAKQMWSGSRAPFIGQYYHLEEPMNHPLPLSKPHPPILIGGEGEKQTLRLVATYGDGCNFMIGTPLPEYGDWAVARYQRRAELLSQKLAVLRDHCQRVGRSYNEIERTVLGTIKLAPGATSVSEVVELCHELAEMGIQQVMFNMPNIHEIKPLEILAQDVIPQVANFVPATN